MEIIARKVRMLAVERWLCASLRGRNSVNSRTAATTNPDDADTVDHQHGVIIASPLSQSALQLLKISLHEIAGGRLRDLFALRVASHLEPESDGGPCCTEFPA
jgi:hypothetical protein